MSRKTTTKDHEMILSDDHPVDLVKNFLKNLKSGDLPPLIVLLGPTASGKTALSLALAKHFNGAIISADSRQIFQDVSIATDKLEPKDQAGVTHYMLDIVKPDQEFTLAEYQDEVFKIIKNLHSQKKLPLLVGGTGLYIDAITKNFIIPRCPPNWNLREELKKDFDAKGSDYLYQKLLKLDPKSAEKLDARNHRYLIRALEVALTGQKKSYQQGKPLFSILKIGLMWPRDKLYERINQRVDLQIKRGLIEEVKNLLEKYDRSKVVMTSLGVRQIFKYLDGDLSLDEAVELLKKQTRHYARRQLTWFRRDKDIIWLDGRKVI